MTPTAAPASGWRSRLTRAVHASAFGLGLSPWLARRRGGMRIVMYHGVGDEELSADGFAAHLAHLRRSYEVISLGELVARLQAPARITNREVALTFDDGLANNAAVAAPLLERAGLPATFFVCPDLIDEGRWLWNHELRARLAWLAPDARRDVLAELQLAGDPVEAAKQAAPEARNAIERAVREATPGFEPSPADRRRHDVVSWDGLRALDPARFTVGSHTLSHPILTTLSDADLEREVEGSARRLAGMLGREVEFFCYPNGAEDDRVRACVARTYRAAVTTSSGLVEAGVDPHALPRVSVPPRPSHAATLAWRLYRP